MQKTGYYEIIHHMTMIEDLKMRIIAGNVQFNRLHWHDSLEIICCLQGSFLLNIQGTVSQLMPGDLVAINPGMSHEISEGAPDGLQLIFTVDPSMLRLSENEIYTVTTVGDAALSRSHDDIVTIRQSVAQLAAVCTPKPEVLKQAYDVKEGKINIDKLDKIMISDEKWYQAHITLYQILLCLSRHKHQAKQTDRISAPYAHFIRCVEIIHQEYASSLTAKSLARQIGFSEPTIYRIFKTHTGVSFITYLNSVRVGAACGLLENTTLSMMDIADQCGFTSLSNFYRVFHQFTGIPPKAYKKSHNFGGLPGEEIQKNLLSLNRFQSFWELPYSMDDLLKLAYEY